jgi:catechol 2,3-dioxygenase-like lactoylglutathione lyase family enzyme
MAPVATFTAVTVDCPDPRTLAEFYREVTGQEIIYSDDDYAYLDSGGAGVSLGFQRVAGQSRPGWPGDAKQMHLDFRVADLDEAQRRLEELGAATPDFQPGGDKWRVMVDPAGHPFCISLHG